MKAIITIIIILLIGLAAWLVMRGSDEADISSDSPAAASQAIQVEGDTEIDLSEFQDKG
jgi:hypothetical protein